MHFVFDPPHPFGIISHFLETLNFIYGPFKAENIDISGWPLKTFATFYFRLTKTMMMCSLPRFSKSYLNKFCGGIMYLASGKAGNPQVTYYQFSNISGIAFNKQKLTTSVKCASGTPKFGSESAQRDLNNIARITPDPEFDYEYLCDPQKKEYIRQNIFHRKGVGDIDNVVSFVLPFSLPHQRLRV